MGGANEVRLMVKVVRGAKGPGRMRITVTPAGRVWYCIDGPAAISRKSIPRRVGPWFVEPRPPSKAHAARVWSDSKAGLGQRLESGNVFGARSR